MKRSDGFGRRVNVLNGMQIDRMRMMHHRDVELILTLSIPLDTMKDFDTFQHGFEMVDSLRALRVRDGGK